MGLRERVVRQFGDPSGVGGMVVGYIMAHRTSNLERVAWAVSLLDVQPRDCILEIGYGPGVAITMLGKLATEGLVYGIDRSQLMFEQASRRNRDLVDMGRVQLIVASASRLPTLARAVDKVLDINSFQFWNDQVAALREVRKRMRPGGIIVIAHQPRNPGATEVDTTKAGGQISERLAASGYEEVRVEIKHLKPVPVACVIGVNPG
jgi:ubiquinone/menaquinone biosynthesis C-methylase UbiE